MTQKILLTIEIDDSQLDKAQAKVDKLIESLEYAEGLMDEIGIFANPPVEIPDWNTFKCNLPAKEKPPEGGERNQNE